MDRQYCKKTWYSNARLGKPEEPARALVFLASPLHLIPQVQPLMSLVVLTNIYKVNAMKQLMMIGFGAMASEVYAHLPQDLELKWIVVPERSVENVKQKVIQHSGYFRCQSM
jgi:predicted lipid carrier protein YhbT